MSARPAVATVIASVFGIGYFPIAPGTAMSAVAALIAWPIALHGGAAALAAASLAAFALGTWACDVHVRATGRDDPSECVIDELAGQWLACACIGFAPVKATSFLLAFLLFRLFDIWKPWPIGASERLPGGWGVMVDDMLAGLFAGAIAAAIHYAMVI